MIINNIFSKYDKLSMVGIMSFLIAISISNITTTHTSYNFVEIIRVLALLVLLTCSIVMIYMRKLDGRKISFLILYVLLIFYATLLSFLNGASHIGKQFLLINAIITVTGIFIFNYSSSKVINYMILKYYIYYAIFALVIIITTGGLVLEGMPKFVYEVASEHIGREENYSLGISNFFGFAALAAAANIFQHKGLKNILFYAFACIFFLLLSFLGGGRGESVIAGAIIVFLILIKKPRLMFFLLLTGIVFFSYIIANIDLQDFIIIQRLEMLFDGDLSSRDALLADGVKLLTGEIRCAVIGCGIGYFQFHNGYEFGMYPHNSLLESVIIFGIPISLGIFFMALSGLYIYYKKHKKIDAFLLFFIYSLAVSLKSGSLLGSWFLVASIFYFCTLNFFSYFQKHSTN